MKTAGIVDTLDVVEPICPSAAAGAAEFTGCPFCVKRCEKAAHRPPHQRAQPGISSSHFMRFYGRG